MFNDTFIALLRDYLLKGNPGAISDRRAIAGLLNDIMPQEPKLRRVLLYLHELGIHDEIAACDAMTDDLMRRFRTLLINEFGISGKHANWGIYVWCACYGKDILGKPYELSATERDYATVTSQVVLCAREDDSVSAAGADKKSAEAAAVSETRVTGKPADAEDSDDDSGNDAGMDAGTLWELIILNLSNSPGDIRTVRREDVPPMWFFAFCKEGIVFVSKAMGRSPSAALDTPVPITKKEFMKAHPLYRFWRAYKIPGEKVAEMSEKALFIFALIKKFDAAG